MGGSDYPILDWEETFRKGGFPETILELIKKYFDDNPPEPEETDEDWSPQ
jgi:hypothetical protein